MGFTRRKLKHKHKRKTKKGPFSYKGGMFSGLRKLISRRQKVDNQVTSVIMNPLVIKKKNENILHHNIDYFRPNLNDDDDDILHNIIDRFIIPNVNGRSVGPTRSEINNILDPYETIKKDELEKTIEENLSTILDKGKVRTEDDIRQVCLLIYLYLDRNKPDSFVLPFFPVEFISVEQLEKDHSILEDILKLIGQDNKELKFILLEVVLHLCGTVEDELVDDFTPTGMKSLTPEANSLRKQGAQKRKNMEHKFTEKKKEANRLSEEGVKPSTPRPINEAALARAFELQKTQQNYQNALASRNAAKANSAKEKEAFNASQQQNPRRRLIGLNSQANQQRTAQNLRARGQAFEPNRLSSNLTEAEEKAALNLELDEMTYKTFQKEKAEAEAVALKKKTNIEKILSNRNELLKKEKARKQLEELETTSKIKANAYLKVKSEGNAEDKLAANAKAASNAKAAANAKAAENAKAAANAKASANAKAAANAKASENARLKALEKEYYNTSDALGKAANNATRTVAAAQPSEMMKAIREGRQSVSESRQKFNKAEQAFKQFIANANQPPPPPQNLKFRPPRIPIGRSPIDRSGKFEDEL